jgi:hypothetical protein
VVEAVGEVGERMQVRNGARQCWAGRGWVRRGTRPGWAGKARRDVARRGTAKQA